MSEISIYDRAALRNYFEARIRKPGWRPWYSAIDGIPREFTAPVHGIPIKIGLVAETLRKASTESRVRFVAYYWLYPFEQDTLLDPGLGYLLKQAGLDHLERCRVAKLVSEECGRQVREHSDVANWAKARVALLDFEARERRPSQFGRVLFILRNRLLRVSNLLWQDPAAAIRLADDVTDQALRGAAQIVHSELGANSKGTLNASLMLPSGSPSGTAEILAVLSQSAVENERRATEIWKGLPSEPRSFLVVVAETGHHEHLGFWVPIAEGDGGKWLPGAPEAMANQTGSVVLRHDVPRLHGFSDQVNKRWSEHIRTRVRGRHFVSLPFLVERAEAAGDVVLAVLNVNANPGEGGEWYRALHHEWLERARDAAAPFVEVAFHATKAKLAVASGALGAGGGPLLDTLPLEWRLLPGVASSRAEADRQRDHQDSSELDLSVGKQVDAQLTGIARTKEVRVVRGSEMGVPALA